MRAARKRFHRASSLLRPSRTPLFCAVFQLSKSSFIRALEVFHWIWAGSWPAISSASATIASRAASSAARTASCSAFSAFSSSVICSARVSRRAFGGAEIAHHVALGQLLAQVGDGLLHVRGRAPWSSRAAPAGRSAPRRRRTSGRSSARASSLLTPGYWPTGCSSPSMVRKTWPSPSTRPQRAASASDAAEDTGAGAAAGAAGEGLAFGRAANAAGDGRRTRRGGGLGCSRSSGSGFGSRRGSSGASASAAAAGASAAGAASGRLRRGFRPRRCLGVGRGLVAASASARLRRLRHRARRECLSPGLCPVLCFVSLCRTRPQLRSRWQLLLTLFRRISDCLSPLKVFRLEGNTHVLHRGRKGLGWLLQRERVYRDWFRRCAVCGVGTRFESGGRNVASPLPVRRSPCPPRCSRRRRRPGMTVSL